MRKLFAFSALLSLLFLTPQCDVVDQPFKGGTIDTTSSEQRRNVLIEDFTGHRCKNCPKASKEIANLVDAFGDDRIIGLAIHAGPGNFTGTNTDYPTDFTTQEGKAVQNFFGTNFLPVGMVNRENWTASGNGHWSNYANWPTLSAEAMDSTLRIALEASASILETGLQGFNAHTHLARARAWSTRGGARVRVEQRRARACVWSSPGASGAAARATRAGAGASTA